MKHIRKQWLAMFLLLVCMVNILLPVSAEAAVKTIQESVWTEVSSTQNYYKITVTGEGYVTLYGKNTEGYVEAELLNSAKQPFCYLDQIYAYCGTDSIRIPVSKGTYYIHMTGRSDGTSYVKYRFTARAQKTNYCLGLASSLKEGTEVAIYQSPQYNFRRYYKLKLSSAGRISLLAKYCTYDLYDADGNEISSTCTGYDPTTGYTGYNSAKLEAGTYYLIIGNYDRPGQARMSYIKWK